MFDNTLPVSMSDNSQMSLDNSEITTSLSVISYTFPDMIDESEGTFTNYTASNLDNGYHTTSSIVSHKSFITSSNYYNINNNLKVSEHAYLFSSGSNDYWSWRKPSEIQVGDYLLGINEEIRQVSSSEHIVSGTLGLSQINVEDVDTLFVNGYLLHNGLEDEGGGGSGATFSIVNQSASVRLNAKWSRSPYPGLIDSDAIDSYGLSDNANAMPSSVTITGGVSTGGGTGTAQNIRLGMRTSATSDDFKFIDFTLNSGTNGLGNLSGSGLTNRNTTIQLSGSSLVDPGDSNYVPLVKRAQTSKGEYSGHMQLTSSTNSTTSTFGNPGIDIADIITGTRFGNDPIRFNEFDSGGGALPNAPGLGYTTGSDGGPIAAEISLKQIREIMELNTVQKPNYSATDSQTQENILAGSGFSPGGDREQEQISISEAHSASFTDGT